MAKWHQQKGICTPQIPLFTYRTSFFYLHNSSLVHISLINSVAAIEFRFLWVADSCVCVVQLWGHSESIGKTATWQTSKISDHKLPNNEFTCVRLSILFFLPGAAPMLIWLGRRRHNVPDRLQFNIQRFLVLGSIYSNVMQGWLALHTWNSFVVPCISCCSSRK